MHRHNEEYTELIRKMFPGKGTEKGAIARNVTIQVTGDCNLRCSYCYEHHKSCGAMSRETGERIVDHLIDLWEDGTGDDTGDFINRDTQGIVLDFIGGEPLLEAELIEHILDYWFQQCWQRQCPLGPRMRASFATNGQVWFTPEVQHLLAKYHEFMAVTVSIDGMPQLHDKYRLTPAGQGSFDKAWAAFQDARRYGWTGSKMTFVPESFPFILPSIQQMVQAGCEDILCNYAFEPVYTAQDAAVLYDQLRQVSEWLLDTAPDVWVSILDETIGEPDPQDHNWCGGTGAMLAFAPDGKAYPCIRYAPISIGQDRAAPMCLGDCYAGLYATQAQRDTKAMLDSITLTSQSTEECIHCPVATGCGWCSGYNYECTGTPNKRITHICLAHKARVLAACYYYNKRFCTLGDCAPKPIHLPRAEAESLIGKAAADELWALQAQAAAQVRKNNE